MKRGKHGHAGRAGGFAQRPAINGSGNAERQHVEHQANDDLAGAHGDIHPGQQEIEDDAGQHRCQQTDPNHAGYIIREETGQRTEQNRAFDTYVQHSGALGKCLSQCRQQDRSGEPEAGGEPGDQKC